MVPDKSVLLIQLQDLLKAELLVIEKALASATEAATHPESKPENKYDTRGLEASYLAGAQKERLLELRGALHGLSQMQLHAFHDADRISISALIELELDAQLSWCWLMIWGAGLSLTAGGHTIQIVSPQSPLGQAILGKKPGDSVKMKTAKLVREYTIVRVL